MLQQLGYKVWSHFPNVAFNVVGIAASQGGLKAIRSILAALPPDFPAAIVVVQHIYPHSPSYMDSLLSRDTLLRVKQAASGEVLQPGVIYTPVPDCHLLVTPNGTLLLGDGPKVNFARPAADKLFTSLASTYRSRAIAVVLSGRETDGKLGVLALKRQGGMVIAQDPATCACASMPQAAIATGKVDFVLPPDQIATALVDAIGATAAPLLPSAV
jgi:two-component system chemotaxis response regulator CheB